MDTSQREKRFWGSLTATPEQVKTYTQLIKERDSDIGAFLEMDPEKGKSLAGRLLDSSGVPEDSGSASPGASESPLTGKTGFPLAGVPFAVKDNIAVEDFSLTCGSRILEDFISPYSASAVLKLIRAGAIPVGKLNLDEFGMGSSTENSALGRTVNPWDHTRVPGGSSGGSAAAVAAGMVPFALGSDTGGSVRQPAAFCGTYGLKPTYGSVSRYGLTAYASSLECIGILAASVALTREVFRTISGTDPMDQTTTAPATGFGDTAESCLSGTGRQDGPYTIGVLGRTEGLEPAIERSYRDMIERMRSLGWNIHEITLDSLEYVVPAYYTIATAEASANLARYTGIRYGMRESGSSDHEEMVRLTRENGFGNEVKLRILLGTYVLRSGFQDQYYTRAQKIRTLIRNEIGRAFGTVDMILMPVFPTRAFSFGSDEMTPFQQKLADKYTVTANLAGIPALAFPAGSEAGLPTGMQLLAPSYCEERLFAAAGMLCGYESIELAPGAPQFPETGEVK